MTKLVIDTNVFVAALSHRSEHHWLIVRLLNGGFDLYITTEILLEYEEILKAKYSESVAENFLLALEFLPNVHFSHVYYQWRLLKDADDDKFVDCYIAANVDYLLTHDTDFNMLKSVDFPKVHIISLENLKELIIL